MTYDYLENGKVVTCDCETKQEVISIIDREFYQLCEINDDEFGSKTFTIIQTDDDGEPIKGSEEEYTSEYRYQRSDYEEHNTLWGKL